jgi:hypothetical protein
MIVFPGSGGFGLLDEYMIAERTRMHNPNVFRVGNREHLVGSLHLFAVSRNILGGWFPFDLQQTTMVLVIWATCRKRQRRLMGAIEGRSALSAR